MKRIQTSKKQTILLCLLVLFGLMSCQYKRAEYEKMLQARNSIQIGMTREDAEQFLTEAQAHYQCEFDDSVSIELYTFGGSELEESHVLFIRYAINEGVTRVDDITNVDPDFVSYSYVNRDCRVIEPEGQETP